MASNDMPRLIAWVVRVCLVSAEAVCGWPRVVIEQAELLRPPSRP